MFASDVQTPGTMNTASHSFWLQRDLNGLCQLRRLAGNYGRVQVHVDPFGWTLNPQLFRPRTIEQTGSEYVFEIKDLGTLQCRNELNPTNAAAGPGRALGTSMISFQAFVWHDAFHRFLLTAYFARVRSVQETSSAIRDGSAKFHYRAYGSDSGETLNAFWLLPAQVRFDFHLPGYQRLTCPASPSWVQKYI